MDSAVAGNLQGLDLTVDIRTVLSKEYFEKELAGIFAHNVKSALEQNPPNPD